MRCLVYIVLLCTAALRAQTAQEYMRAVNEELKIVQEASWDYVKATSGDNPSKAEKKRQVLMFKVGVAVSNLSGLPPFRENSALRDSAVSFLNVTQAVLNEDYGRIVNLEPIAESAYDAMEAFILARERAEHRLALSGAMMEEEYRKFGDLFGLAAVPQRNPLSGYLSEAGNAFSYYNNVYAYFFKNYKQEAYFLQALAENDVSAADQNRSALASCAEKSLAEIKALPPYKKDVQLKHACTRLLSFYRDEATETLSMTAQYLVARDNHRKLKEAYESRKAGERTAEDEKKFLEASRDFNEKTEQYQRNYASAETRRKQLLKAWNKASEKFVRKYVP